jgi:uncharacterized protein DUF5946
MLVCSYEPIVTEDDAYHELCAYTLAHARHDARFIHQHVVDAFAAQHATAESKPIAVFFSVIGLYLHVERGLTGRQVQQVHVQLAQQKLAWPRLELPEHRGSITSIGVLAAPAGPERDRAIEAWCKSVWRVYSSNRSLLEEFLR